MEGNGNSEERGVQKVAISEEVGVASRGLFLRGVGVKLGDYKKLTAVRSVEQAISYFTVNQCFNAEIWIFFGTTQLIRISWNKFWGPVLKSDNLPPF